MVLTAKKDQKRVSSGMLSEAFRQMFPYTPLGWQLVITMLVFVFLGWFIDRIFHCSPFGIILLALVGICIGLYSIIKSAQQLSRKS